MDQIRSVSYRQDPEWQRIHAEYVALSYPKDGDPLEVFAKQNACAYELYRIEMIYDRDNPGQPVIAGAFQVGDLIKLEWGFPIEVESIEDAGEAGFTTILAEDGVRHIFDSSKSYQVIRSESAAA